LIASAVSSSQINLSWSDRSNNEEGFKIERKKGSSGTYINIKTVGANIRQYQDKGLEANTTYYYRVRAYNSMGHSNYSNEASTTTAGTIPVPPTSLQASAVSQSQINLSWNDNSNNEQGFNLERKKGASGQYLSIKTIGADISPGGV